MSILNNSLLLGADAGGYQISRSLRFNSADSAYLSRTPASAGNRKSWTWAGWVKRADLTTTDQSFIAANTDSNNRLFYYFQSDGRLSLYHNISGTAYELSTVAVYRDPGAWYHIIIACDTTQSTASNRLRLYINGAEVTTFTGSYVPQNTDTQLNATVTHLIGKKDTANVFFSGYLADIHFIDGQALTPSSFAETDATTGQWVPKAYTGTYGTNGFRLDFSDNSAATATTLGKDRAGSNNWTPNNISVTAGAGNDSLVDTPTSYGTDTGAGGEVRGNYATLNPLSNSTGRYTLSDGNLKIAATDAFNAYVSGTIALPASGKFYFEYTCTNTSTSQLRDAVGFVQNNLAQTYLGNSGTLAYEGYVGTVVGVATGNYSTWGNNDVIGIAVDCSTGKVWFSKNNTWQNSGSPTGGTGQVATLTNITNWIPACGAYAGSQFNYTVNGYINFGQRPFSYTAPSGFKALCDTNLPAPVVAQPSTVMDVKLYTGNGSTQTISGLGFSPDLMWLKKRNSAGDHGLYDLVRGASKRLVSNSTQSEDTVSGVTSFNSDGFTLGSDYNSSSDTFVAWTWDAGSSTVTNTQGSITSQVRANASAGFSIVTLTYSSSGTVGHGLGVAPAFIIKKNRGSVAAGYENWHCYHSSLGDLGYIMLNSTAAAGSAGLGWGANSTTFNANAAYFSSGTFVCYCFAPVAGYSSFGSYTGNGSTDGPFVYTGFRPRWIMVKRSDAAYEWWVFDTARNTFNVVDKYISPNSSASEYTFNILDINANGFKLRDGSQGWNGSSGTIIWAAFAESPFQYARAR